MKVPCPYRRPTWSVESEPLEYEMIVSINVNMAQENNASETATESQAEEHKGSGVAVPSARWYIAECKPTRERTIREMLRKVGYEVYVASQRERHRYQSGNVRIVEHVVLTGRIFVRTEETTLYDILTTFSSVYRFQINRAAMPGKFGHKPFAFVPESDMERLKTMLEKSEKPVVITDANLQLDQAVMVVNGPLSGFNGFFLRKGTSTYIVIKVAIGTNHYAYTEVSVHDIELI